MENLELPKVEPIKTVSPKDLILQEVDKLIEETRKALGEVKRVAVAEAWKVLQLATANLIQVIEKLAVDFSGPDKKELALEMISNFYDKVFTYVDIPAVPNFLEPVMHKYVKAFLLVLVGASIDAMVKTFRDIGLFRSKSNYQGLNPL